IDLAMLDEQAQAERVDRVLAEERAERFDLAAPPLIRFALIRLAPDRHRLVITNHHILLDGWPMPVLVQELLTLYAQRQLGDGLSPVTPYRDYLAWIAAQDRGAAIAAWQEALAGLDEATRIAPHAARQQSAAPPEQIALSLSEPLTAAL